MIQKIRMRGSGIPAVPTFGELQPGAVLDDLLSILGDDDLAHSAVAISVNIADIVAGVSLVLELETKVPKISQKVPVVGAGTFSQG